MTSISVIAFMMDTVVHLSDTTCRAQHKLGLGGEMFTPGKRGEFVWTNFHCLLCLGMAGFVLFWTVLLLRLDLSFILSARGSF